MSEKFDFTAVNEILSVHASNRAAVIAILQDIQEHYRYLPKEIFPYLSQKLGISQARVYSVATFYENFSLNPKGKYVIRVCDGTACHVRKSHAIIKAMQRELGLSDKKKTTDDNLFTLETVACLGACGLAPVVVINDEVHGAMTAEKTVALLAEIKTKEQEAQS